MIKKNENIEIVGVFFGFFFFSLFCFCHSKKEKKIQFYICIDKVQSTKTNILSTVFH